MCAKDMPFFSANGSLIWAVPFFNGTLKIFSTYIWLKQSVHADTEKM